MALIRTRTVALTQPLVALRLHHRTMATTGPHVALTRPLVTALAQPRHKDLPQPQTVNSAESRR